MFQIARLKVVMIIIVMILSAILQSSFACTDVSFSFKNQVIVARNWDWSSGDIALVVNPIGKYHAGADLKQTPHVLTWHAKYGSVTFDMTQKDGSILPYAVQGGMNQAGLVASLLELDNTQYAKVNTALPSIYNTEIVQYWLDQFKTVPEVVQSLKRVNIIPLMWHGKPTPLHFSIHDAKGRNAIIEYIGGRLFVYRGKDLFHRVLANTDYPIEVRLFKNAKAFGGNQALPAGYDSKSRAVRAASFLKQEPKPKQLSQAIQYAFALLKYVSEPAGSAWPTQWSAVYNLTDKVLYYRSLAHPQIKKLQLAKLTFQKQRILVL